MPYHKYCSFIFICFSRVKMKEQTKNWCNLRNKHDPQWKLDKIKCTFAFWRGIRRFAIACLLLSWLNYHIQKRNMCYQRDKEGKTNASERLNYIEASNIGVLGRFLLWVITTCSFGRRASSGPLGFSAPCCGNKQ